MTTSLRTASFALVLLTACSGESTPTTDPSSPSSTAKGGGEGDGLGWTPPASAGRLDAIDISDVATVVIGRGSCGSGWGQCDASMSTTTITFATATAETAGCGDAGDDTRSVSPAYLQRVRDALTKLQLTTDPFENKDGRMSGLFVTDSRGDRRGYSPDAACGHAQYTKVVGGWQELWDAAHSE